MLLADSGVDYCDQLAIARPAYQLSVHRMCCQPSAPLWNTTLSGQLGFFHCGANSALLWDGWKVMESRAWLNIYPTDDSTVFVQTSASMFSQFGPPSITHTV